MSSNATHRPPHHRDVPPSARQTATSIPAWLLGSTMVAPDREFERASGVKPPDSRSNTDSPLDSHPRASAIPIGPAPTMQTSVSGSGVRSEKRTTVKCIPSLWSISLELFEVSAPSRDCRYRSSKVRVRRTYTPAHQVRRLLLPSHRAQRKPRPLSMHGRQS